MKRGPANRKHMFKIKPGDDVGPLDRWPFDNPLSQYRIVDGEPETFGRIILRAANRKQGMHQN